MHATAKMFQSKTKKIVPEPFQYFYIVLLAMPGT